jgi:hypothetical protein
LKQYISQHFLQFLNQITLIQRFNKSMMVSDCLQYIPSSAFTYVLPHLLRKLNFLLQPLFQYSQYPKSRFFVLRFCEIFLMRWRFLRPGIVVIASSSRTEEPGFESRQGVRFLGFWMYLAVHLSKLTMNCHCVYLRKINAFKNRERWCF